jgi:hypothetical protein
VNRARHELLARPAFALDQDRARYPSHAFDQAEHAARRLRATDQLEGGRQRASELPIFGEQREQRLRLADQGLDALGELAPSHQEIGRAGRDRRARAPHVAGSGAQHDGQARVRRAKLGHRGDAFERDQTAGIAVVVAARELLGQRREARDDRHLRFRAGPVKRRCQISERSGARFQDQDAGQHRRNRDLRLILRSETFH